MSIEKNIKDIQKITGESVKIIAVTKNRTLNEVREVIDAGITDIGENRLQEAKEKLSNVPKSIAKHFIGKLQTNKVKDVVNLFDIIQSVDSLKLAKKINQECEKINKIMTILIQVNTSNEPQKGGIEPSETIEFTKEASRLSNVRVQGLMTIAVHSDDQVEICNCFRKLKVLFDETQQKNIPNVNMKWLSMGMSEDYELAIEEGANMVRIGSGIFSNYKL